MTTTDMIALGAASIGGVGLLITFAGIVVSRAANSINRNSSQQQIAVAERQMFLSLVEKRTTWMIDYTEAFMRRQREWRKQAHVMHGLEGACEFPWERRLYDLHVIAGWLFDQEIIDDLADIDRAQSKALMDYSIWLTQENKPLPYFEPGPDAEGMDLAHNALGKMNEHMNRFLYVGDIQKQSSGSIDGLLGVNGTVWRR